MVIRGEGGTSVTVKPEDVVKTTLTSRITPEQAANAEWTRDAALIRQSVDLQGIISLHEQFLAKYGSQAIAATVKGSLAEYEKLAKQDGVKFRGRWMPAAQVEVTLRQWSAAAVPATKLYKAGQLRAALAEAKRVVDGDAANPDALVIAGLACYRLNNLAGAADYFAALAEADPSSVLAENNLGVILFTSGRQAESLVHYTHALQADPMQRMVADNVLEAFAAYSGATDAPVYKNLVRQFNQCESRIEATMAARGMYRFGATWVPTAEAARLNGNVQAIKNAMAQLDATYQGQQHDGGSIADQLKQATDDYNNTLTSIQYLNSAMLDGTGGLDVAVRRQSLLNDLERERQQKAALEAKRDALVTGSPDLFAAAAHLKTALADAQRVGYTGVQRIMDLGEAENPPAPVVIAMPPAFVPEPVLVQRVVPVVPAPAVPAVAYNDPYAQVYGGGFLPLVIIPPRGGEGFHGGENGEGHRGISGGTPMVPVHGPVAPAGPHSPSVDGTTNGSGHS
jgi:tetratricopeptide (TPR) repeat protein